MCFGHVHAATREESYKGYKEVHSISREVVKNRVATKARDVRVVSNDKGTLFSNAAALKVSAGVVHLQKGLQKELRKPIAFRVKMNESTVTAEMAVEGEEEEGEEEEKGREEEEKGREEERKGEMSKQEEKGHKNEGQNLGIVGVEIAPSAASYCG